MGVDRIMNRNGGSIYTKTLVDSSEYGTVQERSIDTIRKFGLILLVNLVSVNYGWGRFDRCRENLIRKKFTKNVKKSARIAKVRQKY